MSKTSPFKAEVKLTRDAEILQGKKNSFVKITGTYDKVVTFNDGNTKSYPTNIQFTCFKQTAEKCSTLKQGAIVMVEAYPNLHTTQQGKEFSHITASTVIEKAPDKAEELNEEVEELPF